MNTPSPFIFFTIVFIIWFLSKFIFVVKAGNVAVITTFGKVVEGRPLGPGLHIIIPIAQKYNLFNVKTQVITEEFTAYTNDTQLIKAKATVKYNLIGEKAGIVYETITNNNSAIYEKIVQPSLKKNTKAVISKFQINEIASSWENISNKIEDQVRAELDLEGFVKITSLDLTGLTIAEDYRNAIELKLIAEQTRLKAITEVNIAILEAEKFKKLKLELNDEILYKLMIDKWNGETSVIPGLNSKNDIPVIVDGKKK